MGKAGGIIGIIAGVFGVCAALVTLLFGGVGAAFNASGAQTVVGLGWGGVSCSFLAIVCGAVVFARSRGAGIALVIVSILGAILGGSLVAIFMVLALFGGVLAIIGGKGAPASPAQAEESPVVAQSRKSGTPWLIGLMVVVLAVIAIIYMGNRTKPSAAVDETVTLVSASVANLRPDGDLAAIFDLGSHYTDLQRENTEKEIKGKVVQWTLPVYEVSKHEDKYRIQTASQGGIGTFVTVTPRSAADRTLIEALHTGDFVSFKGVISDVSMRNLEIEPAILWSASEQQEANRSNLSPLGMTSETSVEAPSPPAAPVSTASTPSGDEQDEADENGTSVAPADSKKAQTRFGMLSIDDNNVLQYQGHPLAPSIEGNNSLDIIRTFQLASQELVLVQDNGGTACPALFHLVTVSKNGATATKAFGTCSDTVKTAQSGGSVTVTMPGFAGPAEPEAEQRKAGSQQHIFQLRGGVLAMDGKAIP
jgi:hypothetical protein